MVNRLIPLLSEGLGQPSIWSGDISAWTYKKGGPQKYRFDGSRIHLNVEGQETSLPVPPKHAPAWRMLFETLQVPQWEADLPVPVIQAAEVDF